MKHRIVSLFCFVLATTVAVSAQSRVVTNADLDAYKQQRLKAEREYRDNYERLGMPSPEELERRREQSRSETEQISAKLRADQLERERMEFQAQANAERANAYVLANQRTREIVSDDPGYFWSYQWTDGRRYRFRVPRQQGEYQQGYYAGGQFWPTGPRVQPRPLFTTPSR